RRDAVGCVGLEVARDVRGGVVTLLEPLGVADVPVRVDEAGNHRFAVERHALGAAGHLRAARGRDADDLAVADDDDRVVHRWTIGAVDDAGAGERRDAAGRLGGQRGEDGEQKRGRERGKQFHGQQYSAMRRLPTFPVVLAGTAAFLDLYSTQPLLPL